MQHNAPEEISSFLSYLRSRFLPNEIYFSLEVKPQKRVTGLISVMHE